MKCRWCKKEFGDRKTKHGDVSVLCEECAYKSATELTRLKKIDKEKYIKEKNFNVI